MAGDQWPVDLRSSRLVLLHNLSAFGFSLERVHRFPASRFGCSGSTRSSTVVPNRDRARDDK